MQSLTPLTLAAGLLGLICCVRGVLIIQQIRWIPITVFLGIAILLRTTVAIPIQDFFPAVVEFSTVAKNRAAICMLIFTAVLAIGQEVVYRTARGRQAQAPVFTNYDADKLLLFAAGFWAIAMLGHFYFLVLKQNIEFLPTALGSFGDPDDHYGYRAYFTQIVYDARRGQWVSYLSMFLFTPLALVLLASAYLIKRGPIPALLWLMLVLVTPVAQVVHGQRSPLVIFGALVILTFIYATRGYELQKILLSRKLYTYAALFMMVSLFLGAGIYTISDKMGPLEAVLMFFHRVFVVPAVTPNFIYELIPEQFDFRGLLECFFMKDRHAVTAGVTYGDLSMALQGVSSNVNSCAVAVGYSGLGYFGAGLVSLVMISIACVLDFLLLREPAIMRIAALLISLDAVQVLTSEGLDGAVFSRGYAICALIVVACFHLSRTRLRESPAAQAGPREKFLPNPA
jgi:hypothetical protein